tara:strand:+ start:512 stop:721 length:210 start_codon:yes stop_codon:yes gene_type:complete
MKYDKGDFVYYINSNKKMGFAEIVKVLDKESAYQAVDQNEFRFFIVEEKNCDVSEKAIKALIKARKGRL